ncbi:hypothetical protein PsorP6_000790 [Peronosclerospora sorghi]|uniref:Uncharacterized protein n=1 Tax=Peronosclerospora sorghi TaxID=230839 RepID=A0ACC0WTE0_9STRA|nr:hypothetical protein PsorP6_000790 [Peronosclerospora sorghi]
MLLRRLFLLSSTLVVLFVPCCHPLVHLVPSSVQRIIQIFNHDDPETNVVVQLERWILRDHFLQRHVHVLERQRGATEQIFRREQDKRPPHVKSDAVHARMLFIFISRCRGRFFDMAEGGLGQSQRPTDGRNNVLPDGWEQFTSPEGRVYYYNATTKVSQWDLPVKKQETTRKPSKSRTHDASKRNVDHVDDPPSLGSLPNVSREKPKQEKKNVAIKETNRVARKPSNAIQKLQASLDGKLGALNFGVPSNVLNAKHETTRMSTAAEVEAAPSLSSEEQYEAETVGMSAAERLRFLRKKRQQVKQKRIAEDDFMAEVETNMKKKGVELKSKEKRNDEEHLSRWEDHYPKANETPEKMKTNYEQVESLKSGNRVADERKNDPKQEQQQLEQQREEERKQPREKRNRIRQDVNVMKEKDSSKKEDQVDCKTMKDIGQDVHDHVRGKDIITKPSEESSDPSTPERVKRRPLYQRRKSKSVSLESTEKVGSVEGDHPPADETSSRVAELDLDVVQDTKHQARDKQRAQKVDEGEKVVTSKQSSRRNEVTRESRTRSSSTIETGEDARAREKALRRERRRIAKLEAALAAQRLDTKGAQVKTQAENGVKGYSNGLSREETYPSNGQSMHAPPVTSGALYPPYLYVMPPPVASPYGYYYPSMQPPCVPMPMYPPGILPAGFQAITPPSPLHLSEGSPFPSALIPCHPDATAYPSDRASGPELSRCDCCKGIGVGLVEKNGVCAHCNRLRLAFIVDAAQIRRRCSVCGGWGFQLVQANGMCEHCTRQTAQKAQRRLVLDPASRRTRGVPTVSSSAKKEDGLDDSDWDESSSSGGWDE